jgi:hypothetical protein
MANKYQIFLEVTEFDFEIEASLTLDIILAGLAGLGLGPVTTGRVQVQEEEATDEQYPVKFGCDPESTPDLSEQEKHSPIFPGAYYGNSGVEE